MTDTTKPATPSGLGAHLWGALRNALTEEDPIAAARRAKLQGNGAYASTSPVSPDARANASPTPAVSATDAPAALTPMARTLMDQVLAKATAYTALTERLAQLEPVIADEHLRYQAAHALIKGSRSVEQVVQSIDMQHLPALEAEAARFAQQLQDKERAEIGSRSDEAKTLGSAIDAAARQVAQWREETEARIRQVEATVARDRERLAQLTKEIDARRQELAAVQRQFDAAAATVKDALDRAKARVLRHLA